MTMSIYRPDDTLITGAYGRRLVEQMSVNFWGNVDRTRPIPNYNRPAQREFADGYRIPMTYKEKPVTYYRARVRVNGVIVNETIIDNRTIKHKRPCQKQE
jgi:hypothetical protein